NHVETATWVSSQHRHLNTSSDSEVLLNVFAEKLRHELDKREGNRSEQISIDMVFGAVKETMNLCRGGYTVIMLIHDIGIVAFRDPYGIRPLVYGTKTSNSMDG